MYSPNLIQNSFDYGTLLESVRHRLCFAMGYKLVFYDGFLCPKVMAPNWLKCHRLSCKWRLRNL